MTFKPRLWYPIAIVLSVLNVVAVGFAAGEAEPLHAATHAALALAFGLWAQALRRRAPASESQPRLDGLDVGEFQRRLEELEAEMSNLRQELTEAQERLDFAERVLAKGRDAPRVGPERPGPR